MKFLKKHFTKFLMSFTLAFTSLFVAFGCTTFASPGYTITPDGLSLDTLNLWNEQWEVGSFDNQGKKVPNNFSIRSTDYIPCLPNTYYCINVNSIIWTYDSNQNGIQSFDGFNQAFQTPSNCYFLRFRCATDYGTTYHHDIILNEGTESLDYFPYWNGVNANLYNQLEDNYTDLQGQYINLKNRYEYGFFANLSNFRMVAFNNGVQVIDDSYSLQDLINTNYFSNGIFLLDNFIISNNNTTYTNAFIKIDFAPNLVASNVDLIFVGSYAFNFPFTITLANNESINFNITNENNVISHTELNNFSVINGNSPIANFKILFDYNQYIPNINYSTDYSYAYNTGFSDGLNSSYTTINQLDKQINDLNTQAANMSNTINTLQIAYNDLNTSYENMLNGNNFANLFFTIAETPFASFKQIWNVDFLGVNLAGFVTGILFLGLVIWVIKKIF